MAITISGIAPPKTIRLQKLDIPIHLSNEGISLAELHLKWLEDEYRRASQGELAQQESLGRKNGS